MAFYKKKLTPNIKDNEKRRIYDASLNLTRTEQNAEIGRTINWHRSADYHRNNDYYNDQDENDEMDDYFDALNGHRKQEHKPLKFKKQNISVVHKVTNLFKSFKQ